MTTKIYDGIAMRGDLCIRVLDAKTRRQLRYYATRNKITFLAADVLVELIAQRSGELATTNVVYSMRMGSSDTPASRSDINLGAQVVGVALADVNKITGVPGELQFTATLESVSAANTHTLSEAGLFTRGSAVSATATDSPGIDTGDPRMFARQIHPPIPKSAAVVLEYSWRIAFTA